MKILLILVLAISGCSIDVNHKTTGKVEYVVSFSPETLVWLEAFAATEDGESCLGLMPDELQKALYGYVVYPNESKEDQDNE